MDKPGWMCPECGHAINHHAPYSRVAGCMEEYDAICGCRRIWRDAEEQLSRLLEAVEPLLEVVGRVLADCYEIFDVDGNDYRDDLVARAAALRDLLGPTGGQA